MSNRNLAAEFSAATTRHTLLNACAAAGLDPAGADLVRLGENAIYALARVPVVVRIARSMRSLEDARKETRVAQWLQEVEFPAARLAGLDLPSTPIVIDEHPVTFWERIDTAGPPPRSADLGRLLRRLHDLEPPARLELPKFNPFARVASRLRNAPPSVDTAEVQYLEELFERLRPEFATLHFRFPFGATHGDAHQGNLLRTTTGQVVLIDFEAFSYGPREWDLSLTAAYRYAFNWLDDAEYKSFTTEYGYDVASWDGFPVLRAIRELGMTSWIMQLVDSDPHIEEEFSQRISDLITGEMPRRWRAF
jgi:aminoglycoside phosphotransferase (APT) family kinase protein